MSDAELIQRLAEALGVPVQVIIRILSGMLGG